MKPMLIVIGAALALSGCADYGHSGYGGGASTAYNAYYDDAYGPFYDGYWDGDVFLFSPEPLHCAATTSNAQQTTLRRARIRAELDMLTSIGTSSACAPQVFDRPRVFAAKITTP